MRQLRPLERSIYALGDMSTNTALSTLTILYASYFLTQVADLRPLLAGAVPLVGRIVDAFSDPLIGRLSDRTNIRGGRRRPYFLIGAVPFGLFFALLWFVPPVESQWLSFLYYATMYCLLSIASTICSVPYLALIPEMATDYDDRSSLNTYRAVGASMGIFLAIGMRQVAVAFGDGVEGWALAASAYGAALTVPWFFAWKVSFERPDFRREGVAAPPLVPSLLSALRHKTFARLVSFYICGRLAMDLVGAMMLLYFTWWIGRTGEFEIAMLIFLLAAVGGLPFWLGVSRRVDKRTAFLAGSLVWAGAQLCLFFIQPEWSPWIGYVGILVAGFGFAAVDMVPWSMIGDVVDEDDLATGERREGLYNGLFMFLRKLAGATAVFLAMAMLDWAGFHEGAEQGEGVKLTIRVLTSFVPAAMLLLGVWIAIGYPLSRARHAEILQELDARAVRQAGSP